MTFYPLAMDSEKGLLASIFSHQVTGGQLRTRAKTSASFCGSRRALRESIGRHLGDVRESGALGEDYEETQRVSKRLLVTYLFNFLMRESLKPPPEDVTARVHHRCVS